MDAILLAAGIGKRTGLGFPKQFYKVNGRPSLVYSLEIFEKIDEIKRVFITFNSDFTADYKNCLRDYGIRKGVLIRGGATRQASVQNALKKISSKRVLIHEAARPFISVEFVLGLLSYNDAAIVPTIPIDFTVSEGGEFMTRILERNSLHNIQLPQVFDAQVLKKAHRLAARDKFEATEDSMLVFKYGDTVRFVPGLRANIKITNELDLLVANNLLGTCP